MAVPPHLLAVSHNIGLLIIGLVSLSPLASASGDFSLHGHTTHHVHKQQISQTGHHRPHAKEPDFVRVESARGETMAGMLLSYSGLQDAEADLKQKIEELQKKANEDIEARALQAQTDLSSAQARFEDARGTIALALGKLQDNVEIRHSRLGVSSFHGRLGKCCCTEDAKSCQWEVFDRGGNYVDYDCSGNLKDYLDALVPEGEDVLEGGIAIRSRKVDLLLDKCSASEAWLSLKGNSSGDPQSQIEDLENHISKAEKHRDAAEEALLNTSQKVAGIDRDISEAQQRAKKAEQEAEEAKAKLAKAVAKAAQDEANNVAVREIAAQKTASAEQLLAVAEAKEKEVERQRTELASERSAGNTVVGEAMEKEQKAKLLEEKAALNEREAQAAEARAGDILSKATAAQKAAKEKAQVPCDDPKTSQAQAEQVPTTQIIVIAPGSTPQDSGKASSSPEQPAMTDNEVVQTEELEQSESEATEAVTAEASAGEAEQLPTPQEPAAPQKPAPKEPAAPQSAPKEADLQDPNMTQPCEKNETDPMAAIIKEAATETADADVGELTAAHAISEQHEDKTEKAVAEAK
eukprot:CAMPEP_0197663894 /NCGR_PEP_ID=MMETSP1338-20131121/58305_1 /TAXON_ID=43686 ORGANISM="Pelagodinium beii, Strain RCC1491" /NCGR_SAMPLE_ID=MMETSP1338 /ASSEMBLY_ACC=CAM_ASM_000754 /LENGTH=577 /DNA_ID=CAMNT_0043242419 /DNA_START=70 /DNA_END=1800 /DNA_ORIENTATION=+